ncbi:MAG: hypothetical protein KDA71_01365, partial [Planctomycetales bacterium]|nr:hypothetical protein [Planctomycetales bacterium]
ATAVRGIRVDSDFGEAPILQAVDGSQIRDGDTFELESASSGGNPVTFEFESGVTLHIPQTYRLQVPPLGGRTIADGERFTVSIGGASPTSFDFEFENLALNKGTISTNPNLVVIQYSSADTQDDIANRIVNALASVPALSLAPSNLGGGQVHLGSTSLHNLANANAPSLTATGIAGGIADGESFEIVNVNTGSTELFTFDTTVTVNGAGNIVAASPSLTHDQIAQNLANAIAQSPNLGLALTFPISPVFLGDGGVQVHDPFLPGRNYRLQSLSAGLPATFQQGVLGGRSPLNALIPYSPSALFTSDQVAARMAFAIEDVASGPVVVPTRDGSTIVDGTFEVVNDNGRLVKFEWDDQTTLLAPPNVNFNFPQPGTPNTPPGFCDPGPYDACYVVPFRRGGSYDVLQPGGGVQRVTIAPTTGTTNAANLLAAMQTPGALVVAQPRQGYGTTDASGVDISSVIVSLHELQVDTEIVGDRVVVNAARPTQGNIFTPGSSPIQKLQVTQLVNTEEFDVVPGNTANRVSQDVGL